MGQDCQGMHVEGNGFCLPVAHFSQSKLAVFWGCSVRFLCMVILCSLPHNHDTCTHGGFTFWDEILSVSQLNVLSGKRITSFLHTSLQALLVHCCGAVGTLSLQRDHLAVELALVSVYVGYHGNLKHTQIVCTRVLFLLLAQELKTKLVRRTYNTCVCPPVCDVVWTTIQYRMQQHCQNQDGSGGQEELRQSLS